MPLSPRSETGDEAHRCVGAAQRSHEANLCAFSFPGEAVSLIVSSDPIPCCGPVTRSGLSATSDNDVVFVNEGIRESFHETKEPESDRGNGK